MARKKAKPPVDLTPPVMVAVFNQKGGVAKTTTACNLAVCLTACGYRVLLVDLDTQGNATGSFGISPLPSVGAFEVITGRARIEDVVLDTIYDGLWLLPSTASLRDNEQILTHAGRRRGLLESRVAGTNVDLVVVDCPPALAAATATALASASAVLMPVRPDPFAHEGLVNTWYEIKRIRDAINPHLGSAGVLLTMSGSEPAGDEVAKVIRAEFGEQVYATEIATDPKVAEAAQMYMPVAILEPDGAAGQGYVDAAFELLARLERQQRRETRLRPPETKVATQNRLREWRSTTHAALLRMPAGTRGWAVGRQTLEAGDDDAIRSPFAIDDDDAVDDLPQARSRTLPWRGIGLLLAGVAIGMTVEALGGILARLLN